MALILQRNIGYFRGLHNFLRYDTDNDMITTIERTFRHIEGSRSQRFLFDNGRVCRYFIKRPKIGGYTQFLAHLALYKGKVKVKKLGEMFRPQKCVL